ncbi:hypothetical protein SLEP1_g42951 [Rubroshorea leprosula]|uniref:HTH myb-type domain-containing protein n=1 Tax=Rubroshorea leprosula TaxID=152421 RepID=A0AAV5LBH2_9ROSI|nr:hypothetical protein SLEP1_g42951 [Rubroshorea leprosula]
MEVGLARPKQRPPFSATTTPNPLEQLASTASVDNPAIPGYQSCWDEFSIDGSSSIQSRDTLQSIVNSSSHCQYSPHGSLLSLDQNKLLQHIESSCFDPQQEQLIGISSGIVSTANSSNSSSSAAAYSRKTRMRWTPDLHEKFINSVNRLGGAEKATPRAILKLMGSNGLTILHVKSHLQRSSMQVIEILHNQQDLQRHLHEQLEIQKNLQQLIEEQGRQLKAMLEQQNQTR